MTAQPQFSRRSAPTSPRAAAAPWSSSTATTPASTTPSTAMTQIVHDSGYAGTPVLFSWASGGTHHRLCLRPRQRQRRARPARGDAAAAGPVRRAAHRHRRAFDGQSGSTMETLRQLAIDRRPRPRRQARRRGARLARHRRRRVQEPDAPLRQAGPSVHPAAVARRPRADGFRGIIAGDKPRLGDYANTEEIAELGVVVVDLSEVSAGDAANHTKFADNPVMVKLLGESLKNGDLRRDPANAENQIAALTQGPRQHARRHGQRRHHAAGAYPRCDVRELRGGKSLPVGNAAILRALRLSCRTSPPQVREIGRPPRFRQSPAFEIGEAW